jgi:hypothetical protein
MPECQAFQSQNDCGVFLRLTWRESQWRLKKPLTLFVHHPVRLSFPWLVNGLHIDSLIAGVGQRCMQIVVNDWSD